MTSTIFRPLCLSALPLALALGLTLVLPQPERVPAQAPALAGFPLGSSQSSPVTGAVTISADLAAEPGLLGLQFKLDGYVLDAAVLAPPFQIVWSAASATNGDHVITAEARYASGLVVESAPLRLTVANPATFNRLLYVDAATGDDANDGLSPATPWRTLDKANGAVEPGDTVLLRGTFTGQLIRPAVSGTPDRPITFKSFPGEAAVLDGGRFDTAVWLPGLAYVVVEDIQIVNTAPGAVFMPVAVFMTAGTHHAVVRNCTLAQAGVTIDQAASDNTVEASTITDAGNEAMNAGDAIWIANGASRNKILRNTLSRAGHMLITVGGDQPDDAEAVDNVIAHNVLSNPLAGNVSLQWRARRTLVEYNRLADAGTSPTSVAITRNGIQTYAKDNVIRYNVIVNNASEGILVSSFVFASVITQDAIGNQIYNNVVYGNLRWGLFINEKDGRTTRDNLIANNIFFRNGGFTLAGHTYTVGIEHFHTTTAWPVGDLNGNQVRNNILLRQPDTVGQPILLRIRTDAQGGNLSYTLAEFEAAHAGAANNLEANPLFTDELNEVLTLQPGSPAIDRGLAIQGVEFEGLAPDIGAHEFSVGGIADLAVTKAHSPERVRVGQTLVYTIVVGNRGPDAATGVTLTDALPAGVTLASTTASQGSCSGTGIISCQLGTLPEGASATVTIEVVPTEPGVLTNTAVAEALQVDPGLDNNRARDHARVHPPIADLSVTKSGSPNPVVVGHALTYRMVVTNHGPDAATGVVLKDWLPRGVRLVSASSSQGSCVASRHLRCALGALARDTSAEVTVVVTPTREGVVHNTASVRADQRDPHHRNNARSTHTRVRHAMADLRVTKSASPNPASVGERLTYSMVVTNQGPDAATDVILTDRLPANLRLVSTSASQGACTGSETLRCALGALATGASAEVTVVVTPTRHGAVVNAASVRADERDPRPHDNSTATHTAVARREHR